MSKPKRYEYVSDGYTARFINPKTGHAAPLGEYVRYEDYARLKAECQARQAENSVLAVECDSLKAEVERLRASSFVTAVPAHQYERIVKAGDAMAEDLLKEFGRKEMLKYQPYQDWNAAKNGWDDDNESKQP